VIKLRGQPASGYDALRGLPGPIKQHNKETNRQGKDVDLSTADHHTVGFHPWLNIGSARWLNIGSAPTAFARCLHNGSLDVLIRRRRNELANGDAHGWITELELRPTDE
jgi:hypothetical protein